MTVKKFIKKYIDLKWTTIHAIIDANTGEVVLCHSDTQDNCHIKRIYNSKVVRVYAHGENIVLDVEYYSKRQLKRGEWK